MIKNCLLLEDASFLLVQSSKLKISHCPACLGKICTDRFHVFVILPSKNVRS